MAIRVLLIDDDERLFDLLRDYFAPNEVELAHAPGGVAGLTMLRSGVYDALLLDVMMPGMSGLDVLRRVRSTSAVPILMLTARGDEADRVAGLELGADDYVQKPFSARELLARLRAVLRRLEPRAIEDRVEVGEIVIRVPSRAVSVGGEEVELTGVEFDLLVALARRAGRIVPRDALLEEAGRSDVTVGERTVDVHVSKLRKKLGDDPRAPRLIRTVRGVGYVLVKDAR